MSDRDTGAHIAAPISIEVLGKTYLLSPLRLKDMRELETFLRNLCVDQVKTMLAGLSIELQRDLLGKAYAEAKLMRIGTTEFAQASQSFDGIAYMMWLAMRQHHSAITIDECIDILQTDLKGITERINKIAGYSDANPPTGSQIPPPSTSSESTAS